MNINDDAKVKKGDGFAARPLLWSAGIVNRAGVHGLQSHAMDQRAGLG